MLHFLSIPQSLLYARKCSVVNVWVGVNGTQARYDVHDHVIY